jgi:hypothetical protein
MKLSTVAIALALAGTSAFAQSKLDTNSWYAELGYNSAQYNIDGISGLSNANNLLIAVGKNMSENYALEGVYVTGMNDSTTTSPGTTLNFKLAGSYGLYIKPKFQVNDQVELFGRVGYFSAKGNFKFPSFPALDSDTTGTSPSYGLGVKVKITPNIYSSLDWMQMYKKDGADIKGFGLSVGYNF